MIDNTRPCGSDGQSQLGMEFKKLGSSSLSIKVLLALTLEIIAVAHLTKLPHLSLLSNNDTKSLSGSESYFSCAVPPVRFYLPAWSYRCATCLQLLFLSLCYLQSPSHYMKQINSRL